MMKKVISLFLAFIMIFALVSCSREQIVIESETSEKSTLNSEGGADETAESSAHNTEGVFAAGFGRQDFSPKPGVPLGGFGNADQRLSKVVKDKTMATCIAIKDASGNIALCISVDMCNIQKTVASYVREMIQKAEGVPVENIFISCTHTHSGPTTNSNSPASQNWRASLYKAIKGAASDAIKDLDKSDIYAGSIQTEGVNAVRRYLDANGKFLGTNAKDGVAHETEADRSLQVIKFERENQKDIVMVNFACHATWVGSDYGTDVSADFIYPLRKTLEKNEDVYCGFFQGASGNLVPRSTISGENKIASMTEHGEALADYTSKVLNGNMTKLEAGTVKCIERTVEVTVDHARDGEIEKATKVYDVLETNLGEANTLAKQYGFTDAYDARDVYNRYHKGQTDKINVGAITCGDLSFCWVPYEMFDTNGMEVKNASPFKMTFICELANESHSYIPSVLACKNGGYEVRSCYYVAGTGESLANSVIGILNECK